MIEENDLEVNHRYTEANRIATRLTNKAISDLHRANRLLVSQDLFGLAEVLSMVMSSELHASYSVTTDREGKTTGQIYVTWRGVRLAEREVPVEVLCPERAE